MRIEIRGARDLDPNVVVDALKEKGLADVCDRFGLKVQVFGDVTLRASSPKPEPEAVATSGE